MAGIYTFPIRAPHPNTKNPCATYLSHPFGCGSPYPMGHAVAVRVSHGDVVFSMGFLGPHGSTPPSGGMARAASYQGSTSSKLVTHLTRTEDGGSQSSLVSGRLGSSLASRRPAGRRRKYPPVATHHSQSPRARSRQLCQLGGQRITDR